MINETQTLVLVPQAALEEMLSSIREVKELVQAKGGNESEWLESSEARKMLGVSHQTWQTYRDRRVLPFSQFGRKIYVRKADVDAFLQSHIIKN